ncbi:cyclin N-terminal domain-containing protein 1-like [Neocloeon triangulifer]|uniref:cyclin N-terminal domain-containing protein 1-like n=1 Tax=Neocloeon triangulifer TaxID=2078957 RepID=UPI00286F5639|nr:cyclin N-terminal domain-containing protein 1-like [Neocloeon triangulifer]
MDKEKKEQKVKDKIVERPNDDIRTVSFTKIVETYQQRFAAIEALKLKNTDCMQKIGKLALGHQPFTEASSKQVVRAVEVFCKMLQMPVEVKMFTLELLERFMLFYFESEFGHKLYLLNQTNLDESMGKSWEALYESVPIYLIACIQIAGKYDNRDLSFATPKAICKCLKKLGYLTTELDLTNAEMKVLVTLNYELNFVTRYGAVEDLISTRRSRNFLDHADSIFKKSIELLDLLIHDHRKIFDEFLQNKGLDMAASKKINNLELQQAEYDSLWIAAATIAAATKLIVIKHYSQNFFHKLSEEVLKELAEDLINTRTEHELRMLTYVLCQAYLKNVAKK